MFIKPIRSILFYLNVNKAEVNRITNINNIYIYTCSLQNDLKNDGSCVLVVKHKTNTGGFVINHSHWWKQGRCNFFMNFKYIEFDAITVHVKIVGEISTYCKHLNYIIHSPLNNKIHLILVVKADRVHRVTQKY
jgi:hypothetical protein